MSRGFRLGNLASCVFVGGTTAETLLRESCSGCVARTGEILDWKNTRTHETLASVNRKIFPPKISVRTYSNRSKLHSSNGASGTKHRGQNSTKASLGAACFRHGGDSCPVGSGLQQAGSVFMSVPSSTSETKEEMSAVHLLSLSTTLEERKCGAFQHSSLEEVALKTRPYQGEGGKGCEEIHFLKIMCKCTLPGSAKANNKGANQRLGRTVCVMRSI